ncbi:MAG: hypothetical protein P1U58_07635 [Verrucomicrobiales bacterium]|nr:hypothetical protein [Verrucomicrobiales bacterium]
MMIKAHNRRQTLRAVGHLFVCLFATLLSFGIVYWLLMVVEARHKINSIEEHKFLITLGFIGVTYLAGFLHAWKQHGSVISTSTDLFEPGSFASGQGLIENHMSSHFANTAQALLTLFYAGPTRLFRAIQSLRLRVRFSPMLESDLERLHSRIKSVGEWHDAKRYRCESTLLRHLIQMEQVDFSPHKGRIKAAQKKPTHSRRTAFSESSC